jgi:hypothetical protein
MMPAFEPSFPSRCDLVVVLVVCGKAEYDVAFALFRGNIVV